MNLRRLAAIGAIFVALCGTFLAGAGGATAANSFSFGNGSCEREEACFYYNSNLGGAVYDSKNNAYTNTNLKFVCSTVSPGGQDPCNGSWKSLHNNAASVYNRSSECTLVVYYNSGYLGAKQSIAPGRWANLNATLKNNNASHRFVGRGC